MKLIDLIVKHVPREQIPTRANFFAQDVDAEHETWGFSDEPYLKDEDDWNSDEGPYDELENIPVAEDARTTVITRDELMEAYDAAEITKAHVERILCICPVGGGPEITVGLLPDSKLSVEDSWLTVRRDGEPVAMFRMENIDAWMVNV